MLAVIGHGMEIEIERVAGEQFDPSHGGVPRGEHLAYLARIDA